MQGGERPVAVTGAAGFVGSYLVRALRSAGRQVRAVVRTTTVGAQLREMGCEIALADVRDRRSLEEAFVGCRAAVHLVAVLREAGAETFDAVNRQGAANAAEAARAQGLSRVVHLSALGAGPSSTRYLRSKWAGEEAVRGSGIPFVIFRPSFLIGPGGGAAEQFADVVRLGLWYPLKLLLGWDRPLAWMAGVVPVLPVLGSGQARFAPVWIGDLFAAVVQALERDDVLGQTYDIGGPDVVTYDDMMDATARVIRVRRWKLHIPGGPARAIVRLFGVMPDPPITMDELDTLLIDNVCDNTRVVRAFELSLRPFDAALHDALGGGRA